MNQHSNISYQLGILETEYNNKLNQGSLDNDFTIYDSFHDKTIHEKPYLRKLALHRGKIDALKYITTESTTHLPTTWDWIKEAPEQTLRYVAEAYHDANHGGEGYTWLVYLRGWNTALQFALDKKEIPLSSYKRIKKQV